MPKLPKMSKVPKIEECYLFNDYTENAISGVKFTALFRISAAGLSIAGLGLTQCWNI
jgi:hypothetical protein